MEGDGDLVLEKVSDFEIAFQGGNTDSSTLNLHAEQQLNDDITLSLVHDCIVDQMATEGVVANDSARAEAYGDEMNALRAALAASEFRADEAESGLASTLEQLQIRIEDCEAARTESDVARVDGKSCARNAVVAYELLQTQAAATAVTNLANVQVLIEHVAAAQKEVIGLEQMHCRMHTDLETAQLEVTELRRWQCAAQSQVFLAPLLHITNIFTP